jgi:hypothetical protein
MLASSSSSPDRYTLTLLTHLHLLLAAFACGRMASPDKEETHMAIVCAEIEAVV